MVQEKTFISRIRPLAVPAVFVLLFFLYLPPCYAIDVNLAWNACPGVTGYKIHYKSGCHRVPNSRGRKFYDGTGATVNASPIVIDSPIDIGNSTKATIHLTDGTYHFALTAYNEYGESTYTPDYCTCKIQKISAAKNLFIGLLSCYSKAILSPRHYHLRSFFEAAEAEFESSWDKAEAMALRTKNSCPTASMEYIADIIFLSVENIVQKISNGLHPKSLGRRAISYYLLKEIEGRSASSFENKGGDAFQLRWNQIIAWAWQSKVIYGGPPSSDIEAMIDDLVTDVLANIL